MILDLRERAITTSSKKSGGKRITTLSQQYEAFPVLRDEEAAKFTKKPDGTMTLQARVQLLELAQQMIEAQIAAMSKMNIKEDYDFPAIALIHKAIRFGSESQASDNHVPLYLAIEEGDDARAWGDAGLVPIELAARAADFLTYRLPFLQNTTKLNYLRAWMEENGDNKHFTTAQELSCQMEEVLVREKKNGGRIATDTNSTSYLNYLDLLSSPYTFSGSVFDLEDAHKIVSSVVRIDRLPKFNSAPALVCLQSAWDSVDMYHHYADTYKVVTKVSYLVLLLCSLLTTVIVIIKDKIDGCSPGGTNCDGNYSQYIVLAISLVITTVTGYVNFMNPAMRWQQLRGSAVEMESEIWMFRTRSGPYRKPPDVESDAFCDDLLSQQVFRIKKEVLVGADLKLSNFFGQKWSPNLHHQHASQHERKKSATIGSGSSGATARKVGGNSKSKEAVNDIETGFYNAVSEIDDKIEDMIEDFKDSTPQSAKMEVLQKPFARADGSVEVCDLLTYLSTRYKASSAMHKDNHFMPLQPEEYVRFRVETLKKFYRRRIPRCHRTRHTIQFFSTIGTLATLILAFLNIIEYTVITAIGVTGLMAWLEFQGTNSKMTRYSTVVDALDNHLVWWHSRPEIEKAATENIDRLIMTCEEIQIDEMNSWRSASSAQTEMLAKASGGGGDDDKGKSSSSDNA